MKASYSTLPEGYVPRWSVDLQTNKKQSLLVNMLAIGIAVVMVIVMQRIVPIQTLFTSDNPSALLRLVVALAGVVLYMILHEAVHGIAMKLCGTKQVRFGFTGMYAFAGSTDYYAKRAYLSIALAPVVLWGVILAILQMLVPAAWIWVVYFIQINNISGAAGDLYVTFRFARLPRDILVQDVGLSMTVYAGEEQV